MTEEKKCNECGGAGVEFRGKGLDLQYKVCARYKEPGHPSEDAIKKRIHEVREANMPASRRFA